MADKFDAMLDNKIALAGIDAVAFWLSEKPLRFDRSFVDDLLVRGENPSHYMSYLDGVAARPAAVGIDGAVSRLSRKEATALRRYLGTWPPIHVMHSDVRASPASESAIPRKMHESVVPRSFLPLSDRLLVPTPEFALLQVSAQLSEVELWVLGSLFCSVFSFSRSGRGGQVPRRTLTSPQLIASFLDTCGGADCAPPGALILRSACTRFIARAASPAEINIGLRLELPVTKRGYGFGPLEHNYPVEVGTLGERRLRYCDFYLPRRRVAIEYDSDANHAESWKEDAWRSAELQTEGVRVFRLTSDYLTSTSRMDAAVRLIGPKLGAPPVDAEAQPQRKALRLEIQRAMDDFSRLAG